MQNILGTFDHLSSAQLAMRKLLEAGIPSECVHFRPSPDAEFMAHAGPSQTRPGRSDYRPRGVLESFGDFFANLLESHTDESGIYGETSKRGHSLLLVEADHDQVQKVIRVMQFSGAKGIEDHVGEWRAEGWRQMKPGVTAEAMAAATVQAEGQSLTGVKVSGPVGTHSLTGGGAAVGMPQEHAFASPERDIPASDHEPRETRSDRNHS